MIDYHIHSFYSEDGKMSMEAACAAATGCGLAEMAFTDHMEIEWPDRDHPFEIEDMAKYFADIDMLRKKYDGQVKIKTGVELGMQPHNLKQASEYVRSHAFDFVIASFHIVDGIDPYYPEYFENRTREQSYIDYYRTIYSILPGFDDFNVLGHLDLVRRYSPFGYDENDHRIGLDIVEAILKLLIEKDKGIEVNTSGCRHTSRLPLPHPYIIRLYRELGGEIITIGSDSHHAEHVGYGNHTALELIKSCGFRYITVFTGMKPEFIRI